MLIKINIMQLNKPQLMQPNAIALQRYNIQIYEHKYFVQINVNEVGARPTNNSNSNKWRYLSILPVDCPNTHFEYKLLAISTSCCCCRNGNKNFVF